MASGGRTGGGNGVKAEPQAQSKDDRVALPLDPEDALRALLAVEPDEKQA